MAIAFLFSIVKIDNRNPFQVPKKIIDTFPWIGGKVTAILLSFVANLVYSLFG